MLILVAIFVTIPSVGCAKEKINSQWPEFSQWFEWKMNTDLSEKQREVIEYLEKSTTIFNKAFYTTTVNPESEYGHLNPEEAIKIIKQSMDELNKLSYPAECKRSRALSIEKMKYFLSYQQLRLDYGDGSELFEKKHIELELSFIDSGIDSDSFSEYFICMKKVGLLDNIEKEMKNLGISDKKAEQYKILLVK